MYLLSYNFVCVTTDLLQHMHHSDNQTVESHQEYLQNGNEYNHNSISFHPHYPKSVPHDPQLVPTQKRMHPHWHCHFLLEIHFMSPFPFLFYLEEFATQAHMYELASTTKSWYLVLVVDNSYSYEYA